MGMYLFCLVILVVLVELQSWEGSFMGTDHLPSTQPVVATVAYGWDICIAPLKTAPIVFYVVIE